MNNNQQLPTQSLPLVSGGYPRPALRPRRSPHVWPGKRGLVSCAVLCLVLVIAISACGSTHSAPSNTSPNKVVFDQTVSSNLVTPDFPLAGSHQTLVWSCDPGAAPHPGLLLIFIGAAGSDPAAAHEIFKGVCNSGTDTLLIPPGSYFLRFAPDGAWHITLTDIDYSPSVATAVARGLLPTKTPYPTPPPLSPSIGYQTAWGTHAVTGSYGMTLDSTHTFGPGAVSPDGTMLLGNETIAPSNPTAAPTTFQAGYYDLATRRFTPIGVSDGMNPVQCCMSDGRFLIAEDSDAPGVTCGACHERYWSYDLQTGHLRLVARAETYQGFEGSWLGPGLLILQSGVGFLVANLAAGGPPAPLTQSSTTTGEIARVDDFAWPYLLYEATPVPTGGQPGTPPPSAIRVYNFSTHQDTRLPSLEAFRTAFSVAYWAPCAQWASCTIAGDTLYASVFSGQSFDSLGDVLDAGTTALYVLPHALSGGTERQLLATFKGTVGDFVVGDTLYVTVNTGQTSREGVVVNPGVTMLYALAHVLSGGTQPQLLATLNGSIGGIVGANARVIALGAEQEDSTTGQPVYSAAVWDLALHTLVTFPAVTGAQFGPFMNLAGTDLAVGQGNETNETVLFFSTSMLPTTPTGG